MNFSNFPSSIATKESTEFFGASRDYFFTYTENIDEQKLYNELSKRLIALELSLEVNNKELNDIESLIKDMHIVLTYKNELLLRLEWMNRLYQAKEKIASAGTTDKAREVKKLITPVQTCPLKTDILKELDSLEKTFRTEDAAVMSREQNLMMKSVEEAGEEFNNLGKAGRDYVISEAFAEFGSDATIKRVKEITSLLEERANGLAYIKDKEVFLKKLRKLPLTNLSFISDDRLEVVIERLIQNKTWTGLASLDRVIKQVDKNIKQQERIKEEEKSKSVLEDGKADAIDFELAQKYSLI